MKRERMRKERERERKEREGRDEQGKERRKESERREGEESSGQRRERTTPLPHEGFVQVPPGRGNGDRRACISPLLFLSLYFLLLSFSLSLSLSFFHHLSNSKKP